MQIRRWMLQNYTNISLILHILRQFWYLSVIKCSFMNNIVCCLNRSNSNNVKNIWENVYLTVPLMSAVHRHWARIYRLDAWYLYEKAETKAQHRRKRLSDSAAHVRSSFRQCTRIYRLDAWCWEKGLSQVGVKQNQRDVLAPRNFQWNLKHLTTTYANKAIAISNC